MIILLAVLGIGLVATPIVLENMEPAPVASNIVNKPTVNYSPAPIPVEDIKVVNEKVGKLLIQKSDINDSAGWEEIKKLNKDEAKDKVVNVLTKQQKIRENILSEIKGKPRFDFLRKKLEFENNMLKPENFDNLWDMITEKNSTPIYPYALPNPQLIYEEVKDDTTKKYREKDATVLISTKHHKTSVFIDGFVTSTDVIDKHREPQCIPLGMFNMSTTEGSKLMWPGFLFHRYDGIDDSTSDYFPRGA